MAPLLSRRTVRTSGKVGRRAGSRCQQRAMRAVSSAGQLGGNAGRQPAEWY